MLRRIARRIRREITKPRFRWGDFDRLHIGCGHNRFPGWLNIGMPGDINHDLRKPFPIPDGSVRFVYSEHFVEHLTLEEGESVFRECWRVLAPGGVMRISTPDMKALATEYLGGRTSNYTDAYWQPKTPCQMINECHNLWGHRFIYDFEELAALLTACGFRDVRRVDWRKSETADLRDLEKRDSHLDLIVEAVR